MTTPNSMTSWTKPLRPLPCCSSASEEADSEEAEGDDDDASFDRHNHRGIPSWEEAMGYIVDANMESRARSPKPTGPRGRRRRGRSSGRPDRERPSW